jgi:hypothetical protein
MQAASSVPAQYLTQCGATKRKLNAPPVAAAQAASAIPAKYLKQRGDAQRGLRRSHRNTANRYAE